MSKPDDSGVAAPVDRCFILLRKDSPGDHEGVPVAVYTFDQREACKADRDHRQKVNPDSHYYVLDKPLNPKVAPVPDEELARWERETGEHRDSYPLDPDEYWAGVRSAAPVLSLDELRQWATQTLDTADELDDHWLPLWKRQGKMRCVNCGRPIYCDNGPGNSSGYYFHAPVMQVGSSRSAQVDGKNGLYCSPSGWQSGGDRSTAYPRDRFTDDEAIARAVLNLIGADRG